MVLEEGGTGGTGVREQFVRAVGSSVALEEGGTGGTGVCEQFVRAAGSLLVFDVPPQKNQEDLRATLVGKPWRVCNFCATSTAPCREGYLTQKIWSTSSTPGPALLWIIFGLCL